MNLLSLSFEQFCKTKGVSRNIIEKFNIKDFSSDFEGTLKENNGMEESEIEDETIKYIKDSSLWVYHSILKKGGCKIKLKEFKQKFITNNKDPDLLRLIRKGDSDLESFFNTVIVGHYNLIQNFFQPTKENHEEEDHEEENHKEENHEEENHKEENHIEENHEEENHEEENYIEENHEEEGPTNENSEYNSPYEEYCALIVKSTALCEKYSKQVQDVRSQMIDYYIFYIQMMEKIIDHIPIQNFYIQMCDPDYKLSAHLPDSIESSRKIFRSCLFKFYRIRKILKQFYETHQNN